ncbi:MAG: carbohydrate-binding family 9-like protein [Pyrinomonadaceae bacterium]
MPRSEGVQIVYVANDFEVAEIENVAWQMATKTSIDTYWSGKDAPVERWFNCQLLWSQSALYVRFEACQKELLVVSDDPEITKKVVGLWERDVCEIFLAPDRANRYKYYEFEIAPTGEWIDLGIEVTAVERTTDLDYHSGMTSAARIDDDRITMAIKIPLDSLGKAPKAGDVWLGNLFRCVGRGATRGYLAWLPTRTEKPNFHVPAAFGEFRFVA